jgi:hypothetical protein
MREWDYQQEYQEIRNELFAAMESFQTNIEVHAFAREEERVLEYINQAADFWNLQLYSLQTTFFITLARFFDNGPGTHSINTFLNMTSANSEFFSRDALARRKIAGHREPPWLDGYLDGKWYPTAAHLRELRSAQSLRTGNSLTRSTGRFGTGSSGIVFLAKHSAWTSCSHRPSFQTLM